MIDDCTDPKILAAAASTQAQIPPPKFSEVLEASVTGRGDALRDDG
jgi:hypothetical protein